MHFENRYVPEGLSSKIWFFHLYFYYLIFGILHTYTSPTFTSNLLIIPLIHPIGGILGFYDNIPGFFIIPILLMLLLLNYTNYSIYKCYIFSIFIPHGLKLVLFQIYHSDLPLMTDQSQGRLMSIIWTIVSLITIAILNYLVFKKAYRKAELNSQKDNNDDLTT